MVEIPPMTIVHWTKVFQDPFHGGVDQQVNCAKPDDLEMKLENDEAWCTITNDRSNLEDKAGVVFHASDYAEDDLPAERFTGQPWILWTMESPMNPSLRRDAQRMNAFEYLGSYNLHSRFIFPYFSPNIMTVANEPLADNFMATKTGDAPILWIASNCDAWSGRHHYVKELMKYIQVDSYGKCVNSKAFPENKERSELMREYKFYLAIENSNCDDYVTEKLFDTISLSTVPIVDGPKAYDAFIPTPRSAIRLDAYPDPRELADYIRFLDGNDTAYMEYFAYRKDIRTLSLETRLDPSFYGNWSDWAQYDDRMSWCSVCRGLAHWWRARHDPAYPTPTDQSDFVRTDLSCQNGKWDYVQYGPPYIPRWKPSMPDEFTRPWLQKRLPLYNPSLTMDHSSISTRGIWSMYLMLYVLFFLFIAVLIYKRRQRHSS